jgi:histidyl-tRNA synthetase
MIEYQAKSLKSQIKKAGKPGASYVVMIGEDELQKEAVVLRNMLTSSQDEVAITDVVRTLTNVLREKHA